MCNGKCNYTRKATRDRCFNQACFKRRFQTGVEQAAGLETCLEDLKK
ncbi:MAG: hypothetical protein JW704_07065 [Anaerolineaceae bacterium]|nr:hypothetical protein [Anaerolineaceae bacterium]MBN2677286.1 hypothetical protein [Anaerolineaceae bacterium]